MSRPNHYGKAFLSRLNKALQDYPVMVGGTSMLLFEQFGHLWAEHLPHYQKEFVLLALIHVDCKSSQDALLNYWDPDRDCIFRVAIDPLTQRVEVTHFGIESVDLSEVGIYGNTSDLPMWMQERLAVLCMMSSKPPTVAVEGVGQRINATTYWLSKP